jgi:hypothetical protein
MSEKKVINIGKDVDKIDLTKIEKSYTTEDEMKKDKSAIYLNPTMGEGMVDLVKLTTELVNFIEYINKPEMEELEKKDHDAFVRHLDSQFESFSLHYYSIFRMLTEKENINKREENITRLITLIETLKEVQEGKRNMEKTYDTFKESLNQEFIYSKYGGKDKFESHLKESNKKNTKKK